MTGPEVRHCTESFVRVIYSATWRIFNPHLTDKIAGAQPGESNVPGPVQIRQCQNAWLPTSLAAPR